MASPEKNAEEAVDLLENYLGQFMPDTEYLIEVQPATSLQDYELGDSFKVQYRLETSIPSESGRDSEFEFKGSHLLHGDEAELQQEYEALINEFEDRFQYSDLEYPEWEVIE